MPEIKPLPSFEDILAELQEKQENGMTFPLTATSIGRPEVMQARIRRITTINRVTLMGLPDDLQNTLFEGITEFQSEMASADTNADPQSLVEMAANNDKIVKAATQWCLAAFIYPRLVPTIEEARAQSKAHPDETVWPIQAIEPEDRVAVLMLSLDADSPQIKKLQLFRPQRQAALPDGAAVPVAETPVRLLEAAPAGVHGDGVQGL